MRIGYARLDPRAEFRFASSDRHRAALQNVRFIQKPARLEEFLTTVGLAVREMLHA